ncbi:MAG: DNA polymerase III subunit delta [Prevotella sp.]|nr:DNA polymerase III subunit delta [Prevotella sp.]
MAKKQNIGYEEIMRDIRARKFAPVYILMGEEAYFIDSICNALATTVLSEDEREFNQFVVFGSDVTAAQIADMAREYPMMAEHKVIIVKEAQNIKNTDELDKYMDKPSPQTILVYCHKNGNIDGRRKILAKARTAGVVFESVKVSERSLPGFVTGFVKGRGMNIDGRTAGIIAESIGSDLCRLASELDKLCLAMPTGETNVTPEIVEQSIGISRDYNPSEFRKAVANKDVLRAFRILDYFVKNPKSGGPFVLLPTLFYFFENLMLAWYAPNRNDQSVVARHLDLYGSWVADEYMIAMRHYTAGKTMQIISRIRETDEKIKGLNSTGNTDAGELARELLYFIFC